MQKSGGIFDHSLQVLRRELSMLRDLGFGDDDDRVCDLRMAMNELSSHMSYLPDEELERIRAETVELGAEAELVVN